MMNLRFITVAVFLAIIFACCTIKTDTSSDKTSEIPTGKAGHLGAYVSEGYEKRGEGYDWIAVMVTDDEKGSLKISVRSRADKKKPTCTFDAIAEKIDENTYKTTLLDKGVIFNFNEDGIGIDTERTEDRNILAFYCSGGGSLAGTYQKIDGPLDEKHIDETKFSKKLTLQEIGFNVSSIDGGDVPKLKISTFGLPTEFDETFDIVGQRVIDAEVEDMNSDGSPELIVFTKGVDKTNTNVYAFSVNNSKSMSMVYFPPTNENQEINDGYNGGDEFALVETKLVQRFPIFENENKTNRMRQVSYRLEDGEAMRKLVVDDVTEFDR